ncbi:Holliday junction resolvase RecU [Clostridium ljungdahlii]|uniref:Holliday junction resolvase RecU n=1 Tax=Clostridium ljungdahlii TaxID=1538 RepID=A0A168PI81_9CLOT|nr:Holliday junction resolvase RecU [Clostridium ljungdahlii]OAA87779.1 Holliday junction resolvase RecU [Clostridium ljungdahlii]
MQNQGKKFEQDFYNSFLSSHKKVFIYRLRDSSSAWNIGEKGRFTISNMCDFIAFYKKLLLLELKSFRGKSCPFTNIKKHQVVEMYNSQKNCDDVKAFFIFNFRDLKETYAVNINYIYNIYTERTRKSVSLNFCKENGTLIGQEIKRTRYSYNLKKFLEDIA